MKKYLFSILIIFAFIEAFALMAKASPGMMGSVGSGATAPSPILQDFTTFTNVSTGFTVVNATSITYTSLPSQSNSSYVYKDFGVGYFRVNFTHYVDMVLTSFTGVGDSLAVVWELSNNVGAMMGNNAANGYLLVYVIGSAGTGISHINIEEGVGSGISYDSNSYPTSGALSAGSTYYLSIVRNSSVGTYGTLYCYVYDTSAHRLAGGGTGLLGTLSVTLHNNNTWEYLYAASSWNNVSLSGTITGSMSNLTIVH